MMKNTGRCSAVFACMVALMMIAVGEVRADEPCETASLEVPDWIKNDSNFNDYAGYEASAIVGGIIYTGPLCGAYCSISAAGIVFEAGMVVIGVGIVTHRPGPIAVQVPPAVSPTALGFADDPFQFPRTGISASLELVADKAAEFCLPVKPSSREERFPERFA